ncbi:MAG: carbohydrate kinase, partial [Ruminococcaceae bacterium]|nr:carbohydrate kinase [Oscillospiraceae bacterium]
MIVLAFGEILWDLYPDNKFLGGASLNFGAHLAKHGEDVFLLSAVGQDDLGKEAIEQV